MHSNPRKSLLCVCYASCCFLLLISQSVPFVAAHKDKLLAPNPALNQGDERREAVCKNVSFQISNDIILNHREKISLNKPFHYAQPRKPHPGVSQQNVDLVTMLDTFHSDVCTSYEVLCNS